MVTEVFTPVANSDDQQTGKANISCAPISRAMTRSHLDHHRKRSRSRIVEHRPRSCAHGAAGLVASDEDEGRAYGR
jgi:hypothetical protein